MTAVRMNKTNCKLAFSRSEVTGSNLIIPTKLQTSSKQSLTSVKIGKLKCTTTSRPPIKAWDGRLVFIFTGEVHPE